MTSAMIPAKQRHINYSAIIYFLSLTAGLADTFTLAKRSGVSRDDVVDFIEQMGFDSDESACGANASRQL